MSYSDDDIQFLGGEGFKPSQPTDKQQPASHRWWKGLVLLVILVLSAATFYFWKKAMNRTLAFDYPLSRTSTEVIRDLEKMPTDTLQGGDDEGRLALWRGYETIRTTRTHAYPISYGPF